MNKIKYIIILLSILVFLQNCDKKENKEMAPEISLISVVPLSISEYTDSLVFRIHYIDQQGDIGIPDADKTSLWLKDARLNKADEYFIAPLAPLDQELAIEGEFKIKLKNSFKLGTASIEKTTFSIWIIDRAGNKSNVIKSQEISITD